MRAALIGGGGWGLALAKLLAENSLRVLVWEYNPEFLASLLGSRSNDALLPDIVLPESVGFCGDYASVAGFQPELVIFATPLQFLRPTLKGISPALQQSLWLYPGLKAVINVAKGIEEVSFNTPSQILRSELPGTLASKICTLSGPSHAEEVARRVPTTVVIAGTDEILLSELQTIFSNGYFRVYRSLDLIGVEVGGAVKNIVAIAAGIIAGLGFGDNTIGALLTRGIVEIQRLGMAVGANAETFLGLSGIGDLITTATSSHSRNRYVGYQIGKGKKLRDIITEMSKVAEGVATTRSVYHLAQKLEVEMPIVEKVYQVLYEDFDARGAITDLMTRELKAET